MGRFTERVRRNSEWLIALPEWDRAVLRAQRVKSADLAHHGFAELVGNAEVRNAFAAARKAGLQKLEDEAATEKLHRQAQERFTEQMSKAPERIQALEAQMCAWLCASIVGAGKLEEGVRCDAMSVVAEEDCEVYDEEQGLRIEPLTICMNIADECDGVLWVGRIPEPIRALLYVTVRKLNSMAGEVKPFRRVSGDALGA